MKHFVTFRLDARFVAKVDTKNPKDIEEIKKKAVQVFESTDFGEAEDIDGEPIIIEDEDGNYIWEK